MNANPNRNLSEDEDLEEYYVRGDEKFFEEQGDQQREFEENFVGPPKPWCDYCPSGQIKRIHNK